MNKRIVITIGEKVLEKLDRKRKEVGLSRAGYVRLLLANDLLKRGD